MSNTEIQSYLGPKGYSIIKNTLSISQQNKIRNDLTVAPFAPPNSIQKPTPFTIYRESPKKLYVPRMYGLEEFGQPDESRISEGDDIQLDFKGDLREYQENIINTYLKEANKSGCGLLEIPCGRGKCLGYNTPVMMADNTIKPVQNIRNGDRVMGDDFTPRTVFGVTHGNSVLYRIEQTNGMTYVVNDAHILTLFNTFTQEIEDISLKDILEIEHFDPSIRNRYYGIRKIPNGEYILSIIRISRVTDDTRYYGFVIGGNHRFMLADYTITHNTVMALNIISQLQKKTLVIVHKEFLMNQWIERIQQFLPDARIGKIQGPIVDIKNKDIVIGMLQSLSMKDYDAKTFESFGLTIVDETHHIGAEVFCRSLFKVVTKYMLGLSATMNRKDGLTKVFKYFIGNVAYKEKREGDDSVLVKLINYKNDDPDFSETVYNFKGQVHYAIMIRKLCEFNHRTEFVLKVLQDILTSKTNDQIMILAHNKSVLKYLHDAIEHRNIATVGYYVGGMKEAALKETESKQVVIATYAMAEEALDIKTLSCLIMATPKTDVTQAVGRILRMKHKQPLVVDIVDQHDIFQRQSIKRLRFYKKCNYRIIETDSNAYLSHKSKNNDINDTHWKTLYDPSKNIKAALKKGTTKKTGCNIKVNTDSQQNENSKELEKQKKIEDLLDIKIKKTERGKLLQGKCLL
jgi:superfamily II DNA or RNA helicase